MISDYERDQLARMSHRGLGKLKKASISPVAKMTSQNLKTLKTKSQEEAEVATQTHRLLERLRGCVVTAFSSLFAPPTTKVNQCGLYGHMLPRNGWDGYAPLCVDCGAEILSGEQVRGATLLEERGGKADQTDSGKNKRYVKW